MMNAYDCLVGHNVVIYMMGGNGNGGGPESGSGGGKS